MPTGISKNGINKGWIKKGTIAWNKGKSAPWAKNLPQRFKKGQIAWNKGISPPEEVRRKLSEILKGRKLSEETKKKIGKAHKGKKRPPPSEEWRRKQSKAHKGKIGFWFGKKLSEKTRKKMSKAKKGKKHSEATKRKISEAHKGEKSYLWKGGISFEPYSLDWTETLKRSIRERDHYICQLCGKEPSVIVHHIDYDKKNCDPKNLITLCHFCHIKTNLNRDYWIDLFERL